MQPRELYSVFHGDLDGKGILKRVDVCVCVCVYVCVYVCICVCICITDSLFYIAETDIRHKSTILQLNFFF